MITHCFRMSANFDDVNCALVIAIKHCAVKYWKQDIFVLLCAGSSQFGSWCTYFHAIITYCTTMSQHLNDTNAFNCSMQIFWKQHIEYIVTADSSICYTSILQKRTFRMQKFVIGRAHSARRGHGAVIVGQWLRSGVCSMTNKHGS